MRDESEMTLKQDETIVWQLLESRSFQQASCSSLIPPPSSFPVRGDYGENH
jgi:hypothetical protein